MSEQLFSFIGGGFFDGQILSEDMSPIFENGALVAIESTQTVQRLENVNQVQLHGEIFTPGFIDLQVNGGGGVLFNSDPSTSTLETIAGAHKKSGTTGILPTLISDTPEATLAAIAATVSAIEGGTAPVNGILGLHLEGPHLSLSRKGAHSADLIRPMLENDLNVILDAADRLPVLMVTIAPENVTLEQASAMVDAGVIVSLGHTDTDFKTAVSYFDVGVSCVTHLFNAMSQLTNREPGTVGAALNTTTAVSYTHLTLPTICSV